MQAMRIPHNIAVDTTMIMVDLVPAANGPNLVPDRGQALQLVITTMLILAMRYTNHSSITILICLIYQSNRQRAENLRNTIKDQQLLKSSTLCRQISGNI